MKVNDIDEKEVKDFEDFKFNSYWDDYDSKDEQFKPNDY